MFGLQYIPIGNLASGEFFALTDSVQRNGGLYMKCLKFLAVGAMFVMASIGLASASTDTTTFNVKVTITSTCDIHTTAATDVNFGTVSSTGTSIDQAGSLTANCTPGTTYTIALDNGVNALAGQRRMINGTTNYVAYNLYQDTARTTVWGSTDGTSTYAGTGTGANQAIPVYGRIPSANSPAGSYTDTVTATVTY